MAVMGAGLIGKRHARHVAKSTAAELAGVIDPKPVGEAVARECSARWFRSLDEMIAGERPEGVIVATPNRLHKANALECIAAGIPALVEKPICDDVSDAAELVAEADRTGVALLTGHHRRHNPLMRKAKEIIASGRIGTPIVANALFWLKKPDDYFEIDWHREKGAGPVFLNLIHDIDNLRYLLGDVVAVSARDSSAVRGHAVEETSVILIEFASGCLATASVCDATVAPWSWEMTTGENPAYPRADGEHCYLIGGTDGSLALPQLDLRTNRDRQGWYEPFELERPEIPNEDPLARQVEHFARVIRGEAAPLVSGREGLETLKVIEAVKRSAMAGERVVI